MTLLAQKRHVAPSAWIDLPALEVHVQCLVTRQVQGFGLELTEQGLILRGRAPSFYAKQLAQHAVMSATALPIRANEIEVHRPRARTQDSQDARAAADGTVTIGPGSLQF